MEEGSEPKIFTLSAITRRVAEILNPHTAKTFWVQAELGGLHDKGGHLYGDVIEMRAGKQVAKLSFTLWQSDRLKIKVKFEKANLDFVMKSGMKVTVECRLAFHELHGLSLNIVDADPRFVLGELELRKRDIIERLIKSGADRKNKALLVPRLPLRIGIITSKDSSAYFDVYQTLRHGGFGYRVSLTDATMQGDNAEASILRGLALLDRLQVDLVVLVRGGGSKTDLATLDNERIADAIAAFRKPVWVAIGHETDSGVLDVVAHRSFKTPTALAEEIVGRFRQAEQETISAIDRLRRSWLHLMQLQGMKMYEDCVGIQQGSRKLAGLARSELRSTMEHLRRGVAERTMIEHRNSDTAFHSIKNISVHNIVAWRTMLYEKQRMLGINSAHEIKGKRETAIMLRARMSDKRIRQILAVQGERIKTLIHGIAAAHERSRQRRCERIETLMNRVRASAVLPRLQQDQELLEHRLHHVLAYDPRKALLRGYAIVKTHDQAIIKSIEAIEPEMSIRIEFFNGNADATITSKEHRHE